MTAVTDANQAFLDDLIWRGLVANSTDLGALVSALDEGPLTLYCGYDPTAASLHVGHLVPVLLLRRFQLAGHRPIALVGGATGLIGDPSGRSAERSLHDPSVVASWVETIRGQVSAYLRFDESNSGALAVSNLDWTAEISAIELLRDIGKHFSVNQMLAKDSVSTRLAGDGISYTEFSYMILQSLDYLELYRRHGCRLQIGGSDQWGNITAGLDLIRRVEGHDGPSAHALTVPLVTKADGAKFGKSAGGAIWLDPTMTSPYAFHQFWLTADDRDIPNYLRYFSFRSREEIEALEAATLERPAAREAQRALADELTTLVHGEAATNAAKAAASALFGQGALEDLDPAMLTAALREAPHTEITRPAEGGEWPLLVDLMAATELVASRSAARRTVAESGASLNNVKVVDADQRLSPADLLPGGCAVLRRGKRSVAGVFVL